jgi:Uma2 family endonuclease
MATSTGLLTFEEFERLPDEPGKLELLDGELIRLPPAKRKHQTIGERLFEMLKQTTRGAETHHEMGYKIGSSAWLVPDVSIAYPNQPGEDYMEGAPLLAVEIISESNSAEDVDRKVKKYLSNGGTEVWVIYPKTQSVTVFRQGSIREFRGTLESDIVPGLKIDLAQLFA